MSMNKESIKTKKYLQGVQKIKTKNCWSTTKYPNFYLY